MTYSQLRLCAALAFFLAGCANGFVEFPVTERAQSGLDDQIAIVKLERDNINAFSSPIASPRPSDLPQVERWEYRLGIGDELNIIVFDHPELTTPMGNSETAVTTSFRIQTDGTFFYPFVGQVKAAGLAPEKVRADLTKRLAEFIPSPQLEVRVAQFNSQSVDITGAVRQPRRLQLTTVQLTLLEAISAAGGMNEASDASAITIQRSGRIYRVDLTGFLSEGIMQNNPILKSGDVVTIPQAEPKEAYILGSVLRPAPVDLSTERLTLTQALTRNGGLNEIRADARGVFVFRMYGDAITVFQLDTTTPVGLLLGTRFMLEPSDVVYVTRSPLQKWNDVISSVLPSVRAISAVDTTSGKLIE